MEQFQISGSSTTIVAISTPPGCGGVAMVRVSGPRAIEIVNEGWRGKSLRDILSHTAHLGLYLSTTGDALDQAVATVFRGPGSFTGEDVVELTVHGSKWIQRQVVEDLVRRGAVVAAPGEFTQRAFLNGRLDLAQAEGVADLIAASSKAAHRIAISQTRGGFSRGLEELRGRLIDIASLIELELDFSEEDVTFADRDNLLSLAREIYERIMKLTGSFAAGQTLKEGVPVVIAGMPNAGKSSLLNMLLDDDKAIVSDVPGTTRDVIEDVAEIGGVLYRFVDTAGLRETADAVESIGIERARKRIGESGVVIWLIDPTQDIAHQIIELDTYREENKETRFIVLINKSDIMDDLSMEKGISAIRFSTKTGEGFDRLISVLNESVTADVDIESDMIVTNARHYEALLRAGESMKRVIEGLAGGLTADFIAQELRETLHFTGLITGAVTTDTLLQTIFSRFCIGK